MTIGKLIRSPLVALALLAVAVPDAGSAGQPGMLTGTVAYRERMALPSQAKAEVKLVDVSLADAPARTIAEITVDPAGQPPIPYRLEYEPSEIVQGRSYALQARITVDGRLMFITQTRHPVFDGGEDKTDILVMRVSGEASPLGRWLAEDIGGGGVIDRLQTTLEITADGKAFGSGGCNRFSGSAKIDGEKIDFGRVAATMMACTPAAMDQERKFFDALGKARAWRVDAARGKLTLLDESGATIVVLAQM